MLDIIRTQDNCWLLLHLLTSSSCRLRKRQLYKYCSEVIVPPHVIGANLWRVPSVQDVITCYSGPVHIKVIHPTCLLKRKPMPAACIKQT